MLRMTRTWCAIAALGAICASASAETVAWYRFEDGQVGDRIGGNKRVTDSGPNALHGWTPYASEARLAPGLVPGSRLAWDIHGINDWFLIPDTPELQLESSMTVEACIKIRRYQRTAVANFIIFRGDGTPGWDAYVLSLDPNAGRLVFHIEGPGPRKGDPPPTVSCPFNWLGFAIHVAGVFDASTGRLALYVNGDLMDSMITTARPRGRLSPAMGPGVGIGGYHGGRNASFAIDGIIDEVRISDAPLDPAMLLCEPQCALEWVGAKGFERDGVDPDSGSPGSDFLFAVRSAGPERPCTAVTLQLRRDAGQPCSIETDLAPGAAGQAPDVHRARVPLEAGKWEYRFVADMATGEPTRWHPGPTVASPETR